MARISVCNPLSYVAARQIDDRVDYCKKLVNARFENSENLFRKDLISHYGCVNAIEFSNQGDLLVSGGDDRRVLLWKVEQAIQGVGKPTVMKVQHVSNIFCLGYDSSKTKIFSAGNDDQVIVHDLNTGDILNCFLHEKPVYGLSIHPHNNHVFASACDDGRVLIYDIRASSATETFCLAQYKTAFHSVMFNPMEPRMLATANAKEGVSMWDVRKPMDHVLRYGSDSPPQSCMNVRFNSAGNRLLSLRRRLPPVLYAIDSPVHLCEFDHTGYYNSCTMKSCCFAGDNDEYVLSGSDDFNLYMWKIPNEGVRWVNKAHMVLRGHRSIVNQVRYNSASCILASSGVEKIIKVWSPFSLGNSSLGGLKKDAGKQEKQRKVFTHDEYVRMVLRSGQFVNHDYSDQSTREDPRMMAFFDSLVQREVEGSSSEDVPYDSEDVAAYDSENASTIENHSAAASTSSTTDSDDSTTVDERPLNIRLLEIFELFVHSHTSLVGGVATERASESPNRITRLIANHKEKLMRSQERSASASGSDTDTATKRKSKVKSESKEDKKKYDGSKRRKTRRKYLVINNSDTESDSPLVDATQPSTSSGVISHKTRYTPIENDKKSSSMSSSSEDEIYGNKQKQSKSDSDASGKVNSNRKHKKCKRVSRKEYRKNRSKRQKIEKENGGEPEKEKEKEWCKYDGGNSRLPAETATPIKKICLAPPSTPDSGVVSGVSTGEKNVAKTQNGAETSDHDQKLKSVEFFRRKVDFSKRSYRNRTAPQTVSTTTDSSD
ncbi:DDB1- and CUL4-associated factor 5-like [Prorops nasuta]|uniref:DDB1- and CUL4-associated factor 5-like n=1 Tax=Prorops nasuta TaxID=863751 RepID=UPI0034CDDBB2